jgi:hypothetical protein
MSTLEFDVESSLSPEAVKAALLDFSERRPAIWPDLSAKQYKVHSVGATEADVREGSELPVMTIWAREHYDWSTPGTVRWTARESNFCAPGSYAQATLHPREGGGTRLRIAWDRTGTGVRGRLLVALVRLLRGKPVQSRLAAALRAMETQRAQA